MKAKAVSALRSKRGLHPVLRDAEPQVVGLVPQTTSAAELAQASTIDQINRRAAANQTGAAARSPAESRPCGRTSRGESALAHGIKKLMKKTLSVGLLVSLAGFGLALRAPAAASGPKSANPARIDARMMREPDVSASHIAFVYAGDIWVAPKAGGEAVRLSSPRGEESFPKFSPDGSLIAFSGNYDGNLDIYVVPTTGGLPRRITHHGAPDRVAGWYPDGKHILFATTMTSYKDRFNQLYKVPAEGGLPEKLPMPYGEFGAISPDGKSIAYNPISVDFRTWKRYRGGMNPDIWLFDLVTLRARNLTQ